ncbi:MAG: HdeD family acid-resistance protein [Haloarculaceae archaeon]
MVAQRTESDVEQMQRNWQSAGVIGGVLVALLGLVALFTPFVTGLVLTVALGAIMIIGGLIHVAAAFSAGSALGVVWEVILGLVYGIAGILVMANPTLGLATLTLLIIAFLFVEGIVQLGWAVTGSRGHRLWMGISGAVALFLAALLWVGFPSTALWAVGVLFGVNLLSTGIAMILASRTGEEPAAVPEQAGAAG